METRKNKKVVEDVKYELTDQYYVSTDGIFNIILWEKKVIQQDSKFAKEKNIGKEYYIIVGFYPNLQSLYKGICKKIVVENLNEVFATNLDVILEKMEKAEQRIKEYPNIIKGRKEW